MTDSAPRSTVARQGSHLRQSVAALLRGLDSDDPVFLALAEGFFDCCDDVYLLQRDLSEILSQWRDLRTWIAQRDSGGILVRLFNPSISKNGYSLERSILQTCMPDQPFLLDTLRKVLGDLDIEPNRCIHPILGAGRNPSGELVDLYPLPKEGVALESIIHFELPTLPKKQDRQRVLKAVHGRLLVIQQVVADFDAMKDRARWMASHLSEMYLEGDQAALRQVAVVQKFLQWLGDEHFVFAGYEEFGVEADGRPVSVPDSGLGIRRAGLEGGTFPNSAEDWLNGSTPWTASPIFLAKGETEAGLHRAGKADDILVRLEGDGSSQRIGLFTGLYTLKAITQEVQQIPLVREKLEQVLAAPNVVDGSHLQRKLEEAFRSIPVEFLLGANVDAIGRALKLIIAAEEEQETGVHLLVDSRRRTAFVLVSLHRERYDEEVRQAIARRLMDALGANYMDWRLAFRQSGHVVLQFFLTAPKVFRNVEPAELTNAVAAVAGSWAGLLAKVLSTRGGDGSEALSARYAAAFPDPYRSSTDPAQAADDVLLLDQVHKSGRIVVRISPTADDLVSGVTAIRIYQPKKIYLTESTPVLNDFGLKVIDQASVTVSPRGSDEDALFIDVLRVVPAEKKVNLDEHKEHLTNAIERILDGKARRDGLNALVLSAGLTWQEVDVLRAYGGGVLWARCGRSVGVLRT